MTLNLPVQRPKARQPFVLRRLATLMQPNSENPPILIPGADDQLRVVPDVAFPTAIDQRADLGTPGHIDVYFGMADSRIGVATLTLPHVLEVTPLELPPL